MATRAPRALRHLHSLSLRRGLRDLHDPGEDLRTFVYSHLAARAADPRRVSRLAGGWGSICSGGTALPGRLDHTKDREIEVEKSPHLEHREAHLSNIQWIKSDRALRCFESVHLLAQRGDQTEFKEVIVVVPSKIELLRDNTEQDKLSELVHNCRFWDILSDTGLGFGSSANVETVETKAYYPMVFGWKTMAEESLSQVATALERLAKSTRLHNAGHGI